MFWFNIIDVGMAFTISLINEIVLSVDAEVVWDERIKKIKASKNAGLSSLVAGDFEISNQFIQDIIAIAKFQSD